MDLLTVDAVVDSVYKFSNFFLTWPNPLGLQCNLLQEVKWIHRHSVQVAEASCLGRFEMKFFTSNYLSVDAVGTKVKLKKLLEFIWPKRYQLYVCIRLHKRILEVSNLIEIFPEKLIRRHFSRTSCTSFFRGKLFRLKMLQINQMSKVDKWKYVSLSIKCKRVF